MTMSHDCTRRTFLKSFGAGFASWVFSPKLLHADPKQKRPNIILILADDLGWRDTSFSGSTFYKTPNIEKLAEQSVYFPNAYSASPLCSPTRASIMTGQNPARTGITSPACHLKQEVFEASTAPKAAPFLKRLECNTVTRLNQEYFTLAEALKEAGYVTGHFGKWHLGHEPYDPFHHGFDVDVPHWPGPGPAGSYVAPWRFPDFHPRTPKEHLEDRMGDEAVAFMEAHKDRTFFLNYWQFSVHAPFDAKEDVIEAYKKEADPNNPQRSPTYAAMVHSLDENLGKILDCVERLGIGNDTLLFFYSDNGGNMYNEIDETTPTSNAPLRAGKGTLYEGGIRIPAMVSWPGVVKGGTLNPALIQSEDLYPTLLEVADAPRKREQPCDGRSLVPLLKRQTSSVRDAVYCYFPHCPINVPDHLPPSVCVRRGDWKLIRIFHDETDQSHRYELYNLVQDVGERNNLASKRPDLVKELDRLITEFLQRTQAVVPLPNPTYNREAKESLRGWKAGRNGHATLNQEKDTLRIESCASDPMIMTANPMGLESGAYTFSFRMKSKASGNGQFFSRPETRGYVPGTGTPFAIQHDEAWQIYTISFKTNYPVHELRLDPAASEGVMQIEWLQLKRQDGQLVQEWTFKE